VVSEIHYHPPDRADGRNLEFLEIHNAGWIEEDLSGHRLSGEIEYLFPPQTRVAAGGFVVIAAAPADLAAIHPSVEPLGPYTGRLSNGGGTVRLVQPTGALLLEAVYSDNPPWPASADGGGHSLVLTQPSYGEGDVRAWSASAHPGGSPGGHEPNPAQPLPPRHATSTPLPTDDSPIVFHEIHYHPLSDDSDDEFLELYNRSDATVDLSGWRFADGIEFTFPPNTFLPANNYLVVARHADRLRIRYPHLNQVNTVGNYQGSLSNSGERLALERPQAPGTGEPAWVVVADITYHEGGAWAADADGQGSSLELIDPHADPAWAANWAASDESAKASWTTVEATGQLDHGVGPIDQLQVLAQGSGSYLIDDIEVLGPGTGNLVVNHAFPTGITRWVAEGTHSQISWVSDQGADAPGCLRLDAVARGDTGANRLRTPLTPGLVPGGTATLRARVRWLGGHPELLLRLRGNYLEAFGSLDVPTQPGTPGLPNSRAVANAGPALADLSHSPVLPAASEPVVVRVRARDPDGLADLQLRYRVDPQTSVREVPMLDDGLGADTLADDGEFTATIPGQAAGVLVAFRVAARDDAHPSVTTLHPANEALVRFGETHPAPGMDTYRIWMTQTVFQLWSSRSPLDNTPLPVTFVYNDHRVVHGVGAWYAGSPHLAPGYTTPSGALCGYVLAFPADQPFLGAREVVLDWPGRDRTALQEPYAYEIARQLGIPYVHRRFIRLHVNGVTETSRGSVYEDVQQVNGDLVESWSPDRPRGDLHKIEQWFEFADNLSRTHTGPPRLDLYTTTDGHKNMARYRWNWLKRALPGSANDFTALFDLVDAAHASDPLEFETRLDQLADMEQWMRVFALEHLVVNFDAWGYDIGKNLYAYRPPGDRWRLFPWDIDWVMLASAQHGYHPRSPLLYRNPAPFGEANRDPTVGRMYRQPAFQRSYWRAMQDAVNGPLDPARVAARLQAQHTALVDRGITRSAGGSLESPSAVITWLAERRAYLQEQLSPFQLPFMVVAVPPTLPGSNPFLLRGTAPVEVAHVRAAGHPTSARWTDVTTFELPLSLPPGNHTLVIQAFDRHAQELPDLRTSLDVHQDPPPVAPRLTQASFDSTGQLILTWTSEPGARYLVESATDPDQVTWSTATDPVTANSDTHSTSVRPPAHPPHQFYRVRRMAP
jgi:hypothetical protein